AGRRGSRGGRDRAGERRPGGRNVSADVAGPLRGRTDRDSAVAPSDDRGDEGRRRRRDGGADASPPEFVRAGAERLRDDQGGGTVLVVGGQRGPRRDPVRLQGQGPAVGRGARRGQREDGGPDRGRRSPAGAFRAEEP